MARIIAIEADPKRRRLLAQLIREHVKTELRIVDSVAAAIALIDEKAPDLIVAPALISPHDEVRLMDHLRQLEPWIQLMTVPALDMLADAPKDESRGLRGWLARKPQTLGPQYDRAMVGAQVADGLARAHAARKEYATVLAYRAELEEIAKSRGTALSVITSIDADLRNATSDELRQATEVFKDANGNERRAARRRPQNDLPWLSKVKFGTGFDVALVNISTSGALLESGSKFTPGTTTELHLTGNGADMVVPVRVIRSEIARIDALGVKYHAAAAFDKEIDLGGPRRVAAEPSTPPEALAQILAGALAEATGAEPAHARFARGVKQLVGARDVQVRKTPVSPSGGRETMYFDVPGDDRARTVLQVTFDRSHDVSAAEFRLLKAAAWLTAAALEFDKPEAKPMLLLEEAVA
jgi:CheY-like chemotaxis protein